jgi:hypothetical protein
VTELAGEAVAPDVQAAVGDDAASDAGPERDHHHVVHAASGAALPLGERRARGVVADGDGTTDARPEAAGDVELGHVGHVRRRLQHAAASDQPGRPDPDRRRRTGQRGQVADDLGEHVEQGVGVVWGRTAGLGDDATETVEDDAQALGAADVDADAA